MLRTAENPIRLALLDDHAIVRHGLSNRFSKEPDLQVVGIYATGREMIGGLRVTPAEVLVVDYSLGPTEIDGINLLQVLKIKYPLSKILVASSHNNPATVELMMRAGAKGFVAKTEPLSAMIEAIRVIAAGGTYARGVEEDLPEEPGLPVAPDERAIDATAVLEAKEKNRSLSPREREVIRCCLDGMSVIEIAQKFSKSRKTISNQKQSAMSKLGLRTDSELFELREQGNDFI
ncbi:response regulator transcription factor [Collimonas sp.]|jgi:two-component system capsular synthesis response regulator RcsB|uniref:response regulator transcription factor n=1 Tax=Collimonas sp. TaxID=1963772 RepID=UPI002C648CD8|nr:response regulator transcription factor [Collimonas sp.]HWX04019.1 response regulator transcription factor [Collimonas sp.]